jgi:hypothetical protein
VASFAADARSGEEPEGGASCKAAFSAGPDLVRQGRLVEGRTELRRCASAACPAAMSALCADDLRRLELRIPTVVFAATDAGGRDLSAVRVSEGGRVLVNGLDGRALEIDPGPHRFRFERAQGSPAETSLVVREGDKDRAVSVAFARETAAAAPAPTPAFTETRPIPWTVYLAGGLTLAAAGGFGYFGIRGLGERSDLVSCKGSCSQDAVDTAWGHLRIADAFLAATLLGAGVTATLFLTRPNLTQPRGGAIAVGPSLGGVVVAGRF